MNDASGGGNNMPLPTAFQLYGHTIEYTDLLGFGYRVGCPCLWQGKDGGIYQDFKDAKRDGLAHMRKFKHVPLTLEERVEKIEQLLGLRNDTGVE